MKKLDKGQCRRINKITFLSCTVISAIAVLLLTMIKGNQGIKFTIEIYAIVWIALFFVAAIISWGIEFFNGFNEETFKGKIVTLVLFIIIVIAMIIKAVRNAK